MTDHATSGKAEPAQTVTADIKQKETSTESAEPPYGGADHQVATPKKEESSLTKQSGSARKQIRTPATFSVATEDHVRGMMNQARRVLHEDGNASEAGDNSKDMALLATNLVQLMNASFIATDTIVRAIAYMRGDSQLSARSAIFQARRDRRAQKEAERPLKDVKNSSSRTASSGGVGAGNKSAMSNGKRTSDNTKVSADAGPNQENTPPVSGDQQHKLQSLQQKLNRKKSRRAWNNRRPLQKPKDSMNSEVQGNKADVTNSTVNGVIESKDNVEKKIVVGEHKPETSGDEAIVKADGLIITVKA
ncbi:hypothetical protein AYL99_09394 [Fonsecaea erecta]|uniref:Uncharacterized protein n=1 Tax=Fonsecaea erecta TaxID=1367422 RepID=A0A178ZAU5_9EURO|nr:hypothetical protein AYL99_09394 [Fonsecaea erecta]OAP56215.1 hypothetical protein AYL99_09394 [Fonsecaea erecta]